MTTPPAPPPLRATDDEIVRAVRFLRRRYGAALLDDVAERVGLSHSRTATRINLLVESGRLVRAEGKPGSLRVPLRPHGG